MNKLYQLEGRLLCAIYSSSRLELLQLHVWRPNFISSLPGWVQCAVSMRHMIAALLYVPNILLTWFSGARWANESWSRLSKDVVIADSDHINNGVPKCSWWSATRVRSVTAGGPEVWRCCPSISSAHPKRILRLSPGPPSPLFLVRFLSHSGIRHGSETKRQVDRTIPKTGQVWMGRGGKSCWIE